MTLHIGHEVENSILVGIKDDQKHECEFSSSIGAGKFMYNGSAKVLVPFSGSTLLTPSRQFTTRI